MLQKADEFFKKLKEEDLNKFKKHQYNDNEVLEYKGIRQVEKLFNKIKRHDR